MATVVRGAGALTQNFIAGLGLTFSSTTQTTVGLGVVRDNSDIADIYLAANTTLDIATLGAINGTDEFTSARTATTDGTATVVVSGSVISELLPTTHATITFSTSTTTLTASADVRGYLSIGDLIGNTTTYGYSRVTAINTTGLTVTLVVALPGGNASAGTALMKIENPTIKIGALAADAIKSISAAGTSIVCNATKASGGPGTAIKFGVELASTFYAVWLLSGTTGTGTCLSTQRTTPYTISGYSTVRRRIGWLFNDSGANIFNFVQYSIGGGPVRLMDWEVAEAGAPTEVLNNGTGSTNTWVQVPCATAAPPTATSLALELTRAGGSSMTMAVRPSGAGVATTSRNRNVKEVTDGLGYSVFYCPCDLAQSIDCTQSAGTTGVFIRVVGYNDDLTR